jgi:hypothetical protein
MKMSPKMRERLETIGMAGVSPWLLIVDALAGDNDEKRRQCEQQRIEWCAQRVKEELSERLRIAGLSSERWRADEMAKLEASVHAWAVKDAALDEAVAARKAQNARAVEQ